jgi:serine/threonine protein kinase
MSSASSIKAYKKIKYLGKGSYGAALLVEHRASNPPALYVMKEIIIGHLSNDAKTKAKLEAEVLHKMTHSNITTYIESFIEFDKLYIVMEYADGTI